ncbi:MAG: hypothetical protein HY852_01660 [Bradyrhizobium sp.]|uniref:hypothetical protein n=1 Tax=Bradyrhizobium sp. TaxID=376 RepID=UPI0025B88011|nr:hypothetical protein [Bradyrhizobium sp.]MBI5260505.1 hypothetical protein [Bradyrhizobium sp.]
MVGFPLLLIPVAVYNIIVFLMPGVSFTDTLFKMPMLSGEEWPVTLSDVLIAIGIVLLLFEVIKGARPGAKYLTDHLLSFIVFGAAAAEFALWPKFANSTFFLLTLLAMVDFFSGVALRTRRRAVVADAAPVSPRRRQQVEVPAAEPQFDPAPLPQPAPSQPAAAPQPATQPAAAQPAPRPATAQSIAESVLMDHPAPAQAAPPPASPEAPSSQLQPNGTRPAEPDGSQR